MCRENFFDSWQYLDRQKKPHESGTCQIRTAQNLILTWRENFFDFLNKPERVELTESVSKNKKGEVEIKLVSNMCDFIYNICKFSKICFCKKNLFKKVFPPPPRSIQYLRVVSYEKVGTLYKTHKYKVHSYWLLKQVVHIVPYYYAAATTTTTLRYY
jgi:hypothetical protein